jgi:uncharacterized membrane protein YbhN (UPF0104 family)
VAVLTTVALTAPPVLRYAGRLVGGRALPGVRLGAVLAAGLVTALSWVGYGVAFWCLAHGLFGTWTLTMARASGVFAVGYIVGLVAVIVPGGLGVREGVFIGILTPVLGSGGAIALSIASRILLTLTEAGAALVGLAIRPIRGDAGRPVSDSEGTQVDTPPPG